MSMEYRMRKQLHSDYYQAIIQLRPSTKELEKFIEDAFKDKNNVWIAKRVNLKTGVDYYISSNKFARGLGVQLKRKFGGSLKESAKLFSRDKITSKDLYRVTICFRLKN